MLKNLILSLALLGTASALGAEGAGTTALSSLKLMLGARPAAMGGAFSAVADDVNALLYNPAGLTELRDVQIQASHMEWLDGVKDDAAALVAPIYGMGAWGLGATYLYTQDQGRDNWGALTETFNDFDFSAQAALALQLGENAGAGFVYKIFRQGYDTHLNMGSAFDIGLRAAFYNRRLVLALGGANLGTPTAVGSTFYPLPVTLKSGLAWRPLRDWVLALDYDYEPVDFVAHTRLGTEYSQELSESLSLALRAGYVLGPESALGGMSGISAGCGLAWSGIHIDYAFAPQGDLGDSHRLSLTYDFGQR